MMGTTERTTLAPSVDEQSIGYRLLTQYAYRAEQHAKGYGESNASALSLEQLSALAFHHSGR